MKKFKAKKIIKKKRKKRFIVFIFFFVFAYSFMFRYSLKHKLKKSILNSDINYIKDDYNLYISNKIKEKINNPVNMLNNNMRKISVQKVKPSSILKENQTLKNVSNETEYKPSIYLYNTHKSESYNNYSVSLATKLLNDDLNKMGFVSYYEEKSVKTILLDNNLKYYKSYDVSRNFINEYNSLTYFFDIHRDSLSKDRTTVLNNNKSYAKILFIVGTENPLYNENLNNANKLNNIIKSKVDNISRGVIQKGGKGVNGVYNQDLSPNVFLIEVGGKDNTKEEVENTIGIINESIIEYIKGDL